MSSEKFTIHLKACSDIQQIAQTTFQGSRTNSFSKIIDIIRKKLKCSPNDSIHLYFNNFAVYPDWTVGDIVDHLPEDRKEFDILYSMGEQYG